MFAVNVKFCELNTWFLGSQFLRNKLLSFEMNLADQGLLCCSISPSLELKLVYTKIATWFCCCHLIAELLGGYEYNYI